MSNESSSKPARTPAQLAADRKHAERMKGNTYAAQGKVLRDAMRRALYRRDVDGKRKLDKLCEAIVDDALADATGPNSAGISASRRELFDRFAGRAMQPTEISGPNGAAIQVAVTPEDTSAL